MDNLPETDQDLMLARQIKIALEDGSLEREVRKSDDPISEALLSMKAAHAADRSSLPAGTSERLWAGISSNMSRRPRILTLHPVAYWASAAAVLLLAVVLGWLLVLRPAPTLLAVAGADMVTYAAADGSSITLRPNSRLYGLPSEAGVMRFRLDGEGFFEVVPDDSRHFAVVGDGAQVTVLGTKFNVRTWGNSVRVFLDEGAVSLQSLKTNQRVLLSPGEQSSVTGDGAVTAPRTASRAEYLDWLNNEMVFESRRLQTVLEELAHHFAVTFDVPPASENEMVTGRVYLNNVDRSLEDLAIIMGGRFERVGSETYRYVPR